MLPGVTSYIRKKCEYKEREEIIHHGEERKIFRRGRNVSLPAKNGKEENWPRMVIRGKEIYGRGGDRGLSRGLLP